MTGEEIDTELCAAIEEDMIAGRETSDRTDRAFESRAQYCRDRQAEIAASEDAWSRQDVPVRVKIGKAAASRVCWVLSGLENYDHILIGSEFVEGPAADLDYVCDLLGDLAGDIRDDGALRTLCNRDLSEGFWQHIESLAVKAIDDAVRAITLAITPILLASN